MFLGLENCLSKREHSDSVQLCPAPAVIFRKLSYYYLSDLTLLTQIRLSKSGLCHNKKTKFQVEVCLRVDFWLCLLLIKNEHYLLHIHILHTHTRSTSTRGKKKIPYVCAYVYVYVWFYIQKWSNIHIHIHIRVRHRPVCNKKKKNKKIKKNKIKVLV